MVSPVSRHPHMLMDYGTIGMTSCFPPLGFLVLSTSINHSLRYLPNMFKCIINVSITTHVGGSWHTGHDIMFSPHSVFYNRCIPIRCQLWSCIQLTTTCQSTWWPNTVPELVLNMTCTVSSDFHRHVLIVQLRHFTPSGDIGCRAYCTLSACFF